MYQCSLNICSGTRCRDNYTYAQNSKGLLIPVQTESARTDHMQSPYSIPPTVDLLSGGENDETCSAGLEISYTGPVLFL